jgi:hypothetical protein
MRYLRKCSKYIEIIQQSLSDLSFGSLPVVLGGNERHTDHRGIPQVLPDLDLDIGSLLVVPVLDISHRNVLAQGRGRDTRGDNAYNIQSVDQLNVSRH